MKTKILATTLLLSSSAFAVTANGFDLTAYGFIKSSAMYSDHALASYNNINLSAPTYAVAQSRGVDKTSRMSFQTQQSRVGANLKKGDNLSAKLEFDFIDFNKSSPTTQMNPRVRIASVTYAWENQKVIIGQDWDMFSPVTTYTFDYVGLYFMAGNTGFMRQQAQYLNTQGDWEFGAALGMAGNNPGAIDADLEIAKAPTYALRATRNLEKGRIGLSGIYSRLNYETSNHTAHDAYGFNGFYEKIYNALSVKSEVYYGQNLANLGTLSIGKGTNSTNIREWGATLTGSYMMYEKNYLFGGAGIAAVTNKDQLSSFALNGTTNVITTTGIKQNFLTRVGWEYRVTDDFSWITEFSRYQTESKLSSSKYHTVVAHSLETGIQLRF
ncbi:MAG: hypothetical protein AB7I27_12575 [Bacteriovoracaceae bacterium]